MEARVSVLSLVLFGLSVACSTVRGDGSGAAAPGTAAPSASTSAPASAAHGFEKVGIVAPSDYAAVSLWPEQYAGSWMVLETLPHGAHVEQGDVLARLDARAIDEELHRAELELASSELQHRSVLERNKLDAAAAALALSQSESSLARAQRALEGYKQFDLAFVKRQDELQKRFEESNVEDQVDELDQLQKMYDDDALVDATEEIVVKRSRRQLELTRTSNQLARDRSKYREEYDQQLGLAQREEAVVAQREAHARLTVQQELDAAARADAEVRSADGLREAREKLERLRGDRALFELRAPRAGVLLHGGSRSYRAGGSPARWEKGSQLATRSEVFLVAAPAPGAVHLDLNDDELGTLPGGPAGARVRVESLTKGAKGANGKAASPGVLQVEIYPRSGSAAEVSYEATVVLDTPLAGVVYGTRAKVVAEPRGEG